MSVKSAGCLMRLARLRRLRPFRRFVRQEEGTAAVEFGLVFAPFLAMMFAILETAIVFFASQTLETAVGDSSRLIMTGQAQAQAFDKVKFKTAVCDRIYGLFECEKIKIDVRSYSAFSAADMTPPLDNGSISANLSYDPGGPGQIVVVRVMYEWPIYLSFLSADITFDLSNMSGSRRLLMATTAFQNEPYL